jgi:hypothetical protein
MEGITFAPSQANACPAIGPDKIASVKSQVIATETLPV